MPIEPQGPHGLPRYPITLVFYDYFVISKFSLGFRQQHNRSTNYQKSPSKSVLYDEVGKVHNQLVKLVL
jgi:hypothetical protein